MPEIKQQFTVNQPRAKVWEAFQDIPKIVGCIPGASLESPPEDGKVTGQMTVKLGPVKANFTGEATIIPDEAAQSGVINGLGSDKKHGARAKGKVVYHLEEAEGGAATLVKVVVDYTISGTLAQFARGGIVDAVAAQITRDFAENLNAELAAEAAPVAEAVSADGAAAPAAAAPAPRAKKNELNALALLWAVLRNSLGRIFARG